jgi:hypothetical protein
MADGFHTSSSDFILSCSYVNCTLSMQAIRQCGILTFFCREGSCLLPIIIRVHHHALREDRQVKRNDTGPREQPLRDTNCFTRPNQQP